MFAMILLPSRRCLALVLTIFLSLLSAGIASAATYYVDYANGDNSAVGTTADAPWKHSPGDSAATGIPAATTLASGDIVNFKGGSTYLLTPNSGGIVTVSGVTYDGGAWGTGRTIVTDNNSNPGHSAFGLYAANSDVVIQSFIVTNLGGAPILPADPGAAIAANPGVGVNMSGGQQNITIANCDFAQLGFWQNTKPMGPNSIVGCGISLLGNSILITNCTFRRMHTGIQITSGGSLTNVNVAKCTFTDSFVWCVDINVNKNGTLTDFVSVHDSIFYDYYQYNQAYWTGYLDSAGSPPHVDGIFLRCDYAAGTVYGTNINFYNNLFYSTSGTGGGTAQIYVTEGPSCNIFGNVFIHSAMSDGSIYLNNGPNGATSHQYVNIFNNTFYDSFGMDIHATMDSSLRPIQTLNILNNIMYDGMTGSGANWLFSLNGGWSIATNWWADYNVYKTFNTSSATTKDNGGNWGVYNGSTWSLPQTRSIGWEVHTIVGDPVFKDISKGFANTPNQNLRLAANSPALSAGTNLTSWLTAAGVVSPKDITGTPYPSSGPWSMGAYQFTGTRPPPAAPQLLPVKFNANK